MENALQSHIQPRLGAIVSWVLRQIREVFVLLRVLQVSPVPF